MQSAGSVSNQHSSHAIVAGEDEPGISTATKITLGVCGVACVLLLGWLLWFAVIRDTWESDHRNDLIRLSQETVKLVQTQDATNAVKKCEELLGLIGKRRLSDPQLTKALSDARDAVEPIKRKIAGEQAVSKIRGMEAQAKAFIEAGDLERGIEKYKQTLDFIQQSQTDNLEFAQAIGRIMAAKSSAEGIVAEAEKEKRHQSELAATAEQALKQAKQLEQQADYRGAVEKYQEVIDVIKNRGLKSSSSGQLLMEAEAGKKSASSHLSFTIKVETIDVSLFDEWPKWSVDHELRINGRVVDKVTNTSASAKFEDVEVKVGDKISARSGWKNGYGAVGEVFEYTPEAIVADVAKTSYVIILYKDQIAYKVKAEMRKKAKD